MEEYSELRDLLEIDSPVGYTGKASAYKGKSEPKRQRPLCFPQRSKQVLRECIDVAGH